MNPRQFCSKVFSCWQCNFPKLQFLHILEYCGMQGKYENRVKNDAKIFWKFLVFYLAKQSRKNQNNLLQFYVVLYPTLILYISWWIYT